VCELSKKSKGVNGVGLSEAQAGRLIAGVGSDSPLITSNGALGSAVSSPSRVRAGVSPGRSTISLYSGLQAAYFATQSRANGCRSSSIWQQFYGVAPTSGGQKLQGVINCRTGGSRFKHETTAVGSSTVQPLLQKPVIGFVNISYFWLLVAVVGLKFRTPDSLASDADRVPTTMTLLGDFTDLHVFLYHHVRHRFMTRNTRSRC